MRCESRAGSGEQPTTAHVRVSRRSATTSSSIGVVPSLSVRGLMVDLAPLRRREFRLLYLSQLVSTAGTMLTYVALPYQTYELTGSSLAVGLIGVAQIVPMVVLALISGALADAVDRRKLV